MAAYSDGAEQLDHHKTPKTMRGNVVWSTVHFHITHQTPEPHVSAILLQSDPGLGPGLLSCGRHLPEQEGEPGAEAPVQAGISMPGLLSGHLLWAHDIFFSSDRDETLSCWVIFSLCF